MANWTIRWNVQLRLCTRAKNQQPPFALQSKVVPIQHRCSLDPCTRGYPHHHETLAFSLVGAFQTNWTEKLVCSEQAIGHLQEAGQLAADLGLPAERWQIQAALGTLHEARGEPAQARTAFGEAARIIQELAEGIRDEARRSRFLAGPQIQPVVQHARGEVSQVTKDHEEQSGR